MYKRQTQYLLVLDADQIVKPAILAGLIPVLEADPTLSVSYTHLRAHETVLDLVCRLLLEKKNEDPQLRRYLDHLT